MHQSHCFFFTSTVMINQHCQKVCCRYGVNAGSSRADRNVPEQTIAGRTQAWGNSDVPSNSNHNSNRFSLFCLTLKRQQGSCKSNRVCQDQGQMECSISQNQLCFRITPCLPLLSNCWARYVVFEACSKTWFFRPCFCCMC